MTRLAPVCSNCGASDFVWANDLKTGGLGGGSLSLRSRGELSLGTRICRSCGHADLFLKDPSVLRMPHTWKPGEFTPIASKPGAAPAHHSGASPAPPTPAPAATPPTRPAPAAPPSAPGPAPPSPPPVSPAVAPPPPAPPVAPAPPPPPPPMAPVPPPPEPASTESTKKTSRRRSAKAKDADPPPPS